MEHTVHVGAGHFIKVVSPTSACILVKKIKKAFCDAQLDDDNDEADDKAAAYFTVGNTIGKSLTLVKQVSTSQHMQTIMS